VLARGERLTARDIPPSLRSEVGGGSVNTPRRSGMIAAPDSLADAERAMIYRALEKHGDNRTKAAEELGISRRTLHRKLRQYNEDVLDSTADDGPESAGEGETVS
jgi:two-component system response regulator AtoC